MRSPLDIEIVMRVLDVDLDRVSILAFFNADAAFRSCIGW